MPVYTVSLTDGTTLANLAVAAGRGPKGDGFTGVTYNPATGRFVFTSNDGLGFTSDDITVDLDAAVVAAQAARDAAQAAQSATETIFDQFGDQYLGPKASDPTVDNDGDPLTEGDIYFNTTDDVLKFYSGTAWVAPEVVATTAANNASNSASAASSSATNASNSASAALTSEQNADTSETNAANSAAAALTSEQNAASSAASINPNSIDINGGTIDGVTIGGASAGAVTTTSLVATTADINGGTIDGTVIGGSTPAAISGTTGSFSGNLTVDTNTLFVDAANNRVGVGTSSLAHVLDVFGSVRLKTGATGTPVIVSTGSDTQGTLRFGSASAEYSINGGVDYVAMIFNTNGTEQMRITSTGSVGIGTSIPSSFNSAADNLVVGNTSGDNGITIATGTANQGSLFFADGTASGAEQAAGYLFYEHSSNFMAFGTVNTERLRITSTGNVGIGTSSPATKLEIEVASQAPSGGATRAGAFFLNRGGNAELAIGNDGSLTNRPTWFQGRHPSASFDSLRYDLSFQPLGGNVGIGTVSPTFLLHVAGNTFTNNITMPANGVTIGTDGLGSVSGAAFQLFGTAAGNTIRAFTAGSERLRITSTGSVGIGTSSPLGKFHVNQSADNQGIVLGNTARGSSRIEWEMSGAVNEGFAFRHNNGTDSQVLYVAERAFHLWRTNASERMRIDASGNLLVGKTTAAGLTVGSVSAAGAVSASGPLTSHQTNMGALDYNNNVFALRAYGATPGTGVIAFKTGGGGGSEDFERARIDASGNLGLGTSSPSSFAGYIGATVSSTSGGFIDLKSTTGSITTFIDADNGVSSGGIGTRTNHAFRFITNNTERARIDASGNLLVGTTTGDPNSRGFSVRMSVSTAFGFAGIGVNTHQTFSTTAISFSNPNGLVGGIVTNGSATAYNTSSDYRLKEDVQPMVGASDRVLSLKPVNFAWKVDGTRTDGFLAHEAQAVVPEAVTGEKDGEEMQGIDQSKLVPLLTAALQEALKEIADLKGRITALEA